MSKMVKTTIVVSEEIHEWLRKRAFENKVSIAELIRRALKTFKSLEKK